MLSYQTRSGSPQGKPRVYFCSHPNDAHRYKEIAEEILKCKDCAVWQGEGEEHELREMQLFVMPVTTALLREENRGMAEFRFATEHHIPVLPLMLENGLEDVFNRKCGALQFLKRSDSNDYDEKLERFLDTVLVSSDLAERVRNSFDCYIFLSYRKKDRREARELMELIHKQDFCRDVAIWYDEFLTPGEDFNREIAEALEKSSLFVMAVTPNLLERGNYVQRVEYPMARKQNKRILPVVMDEIYEWMLKWRYRRIPASVEQEGLASALRAGLEGIPCRVADDAEHRYLIGVAYRDGIDVEVDRSRAEKLIVSAAEEGLEEAILDLIDMYYNGKGVAVSQTEALVWRKRLIELRIAEYRQTMTQEKGIELFKEIFKILSGLLEVGRFAEITAHEKELVLLTKETLERFPCYQTEQDAASVYLYLGRAYRGLMDYENASRCALCYREKLLAIKNPEAPNKIRRAVAVSYSDQGALETAFGNWEAAVGYYEQCLQIDRELLVEEGDEHIFSICSTLFSMTTIYCNVKDVKKTRSYLEELTALCEKYSVHPSLETVSLATLYRWGEVLEMERKEEEADDYYRRGYRKSVELLKKKRTVISLKNANSFTSKHAQRVEKKKGMAAARDLYWFALLYSGDLCSITDHYKSTHLRDLKKMAKVAEDLGEDDTLQQCWESYLALADENDKNGRTGLYDLGCVYKRKGEVEKAKSYFEDYLRRAALDEEEQDTPEALYRQICAKERLGDLAYDQASYSVACQYFEECLAHWKQYFEMNEDSGSRSKVANAHYRLGDALRMQGDRDGAAEQYRLALEINEEFEKHNAAGDRCFDLADLHKETEREGYLRRALAHYRQGKESRYYRAQRGRVCLELAKMVQKTNANEARTLFQESCELLRDAVEEQPKRVDLRNLATAYCSMGNFLNDQKENAAADWYLQEALLLRQRIAELWGENENETAKQAAILCYLGNVHSGERAEGYYQRSLALYEKLAAAYPEEQMYRNNVASLQKRKK